jgi:hypothetical protein
VLVLAVFSAGIFAAVWFASVDSSAFLLTLCTRGWRMEGLFPIRTPAESRTSFARRAPDSVCIEVDILTGTEPAIEDDWHARGRIAFALLHCREDTHRLGAIKNLSLELKTQVDMPAADGIHSLRILERGLL